MKLTLLFFLFGLASFYQSKAQQSTHRLPLDENILIGKTQLNEGAKASLEVIDLTGDSVLGYLPLEAERNERTAILAPLPKQEWLQNIMSGSLTGGLVGRQLLYIVNDVSLGRHTNGNYARVKATIYESAPGANGYRLLKTVNDFSTDNSASINTVSSLVNNVLGNTLSFLIGVIANDASKVMTREEVLISEKTKYVFINGRSFASGIYLNYDEFKNRKPSFGQFFIKTDATSKQVQVFSFTGTDSTMRPVNPWAIASANEVYVFRGGKLYAVEAMGNNLVISKYLNPQRRMNNAMFWRNNVGNRFSLPEDSNPFDNSYVIKLENYHKKNITGEAVKINADTGELEL
ncbi:hypothetical protein ACTJIJ_15755 [Niabella sp. 22666]|uniref:hypothetical protein n=1 Tax=Niabella sp. 22666 TaxID=3453954 RepID=UPI003F827CBF